MTSFAVASDKLVHAIKINDHELSCTKVFSIQCRMLVPSITFCHQVSPLAKLSTKPFLRSSSSSKESASEPEPGQPSGKGMAAMAWSWLHGGDMCAFI